MNPPQPRKELTDEALAKIFNFNLTRKEVLVLRTLMLQGENGQPKQYNLADAEVLLPILKQFESSALALTNQDYKEQEQPKPDAPIIN